MNRHYSPSQLGMWTRCPRQWQYRYLEGLMLPPVGAMALGSAVHRASARHFNGILACRPGLAHAAFCDAAAEAYDAAAAEVDWTGDGHDREGEDRGALKDTCVTIAGRWRAERCDHLDTPIAVEARLETVFGDRPWSLVTILDLVTSPSGADTTTVTVRDLKTKRKAPAGAIRGTPSIDESVRDQLLLYAEAWCATAATAPDRRPQLPALACEYAWPRGTVSVPLAPSRAAIDLVIEDLDAMHAQISAGLFPRRRQGWHCAEKTCGYWSRCMAAIVTDR